MQMGKGKRHHDVQAQRLKKKKNPRLGGRGAGKGGSARRTFRVGLREIHGNQFKHGKEGGCLNWEGAGGGDSRKGKGIRKPNRNY